MASTLASLLAWPTLAGVVIPFILEAAPLYIFAALVIFGATGLVFVIWDGYFGLLVPGFLDWPQESGFAAFYAHYIVPRRHHSRRGQG